jgi:hypothetical protein
MPKQRNHQHHRRRGVQLTGLRFPQPTFSRFSDLMGTRFPAGWVQRPLNLRLLLLVYLGAAAAVLALVTVAALAIWLLGGH